jgi:hypothetical protein
MKTGVVIIEVAPLIRRVPANAERAQVVLECFESLLLIVGGREALADVVHLLEVVQAAAAQDACNTACRDRSMKQAMEGIVRVLGATPSSESYVRNPRRVFITEKCGRQPMCHTMLHRDMEQRHILANRTSKEPAV